MTTRLALFFAATALIPVSAAAQSPNPAQPESEAPTPDKQLFLEACAARKFETTVEVEVDGKKRGRKVTLCGKVGQTDADWVKTLRDAAKKFETNPTFRPAVRDQIIAALNSEIIKVETAKAAVLAPPATSAPLADIRSEYSVLPPLPAPAKPVASSSLNSAVAAAAASAAKKPRLTIRCSAPGEKGGGTTCLWLEPKTLLTIRADEPLAAGISLRFVRKGDFRGEIDLTQLRQGQSVRSKLPPRVCSGVLSGKAEIQVVARGPGGTGAGQVVDTLGPFALRCRA